MNDAPYIPRKTLEEIAADHPQGTRHATMFRVAIPMIGNGVAPQAVFAQLRSMFDAEKSDKEIWDVISWCSDKNPQPSGNGNNGHSRPPMPQRPVNGSSVNGHAPQAPPLPAKPEEITSGCITNESDWRDRSAIPLPDDFKNDAAVLFEALYAEDDHVNLVCDFFIGEDKKAKPKGGGKTLTRKEWVLWFKEKGPPSSKAGCWIRPNPCAAAGTGKDGAIQDADILSFRFLMIESDTLPLDMQLSLYASMALPVAAIISTAGASAHAWLKIDAQSLEEYRATAKMIYAKLEPLGFDPANKNASRLSRLPGVERKIGAQGNQRLLFVNPNPLKFDYAKFEESITPVIGIVRGTDLVARMREFFKPKPIPFTLDFMKGETVDDGFYFRNGELTIWSGISGHGKSTMLATVMCTLIAEGIPFFVASLEIKPEKLCELMALLCNCRTPNEAEAVEFLERFGHLFSFADIVGGISADDLFKKMNSAAAKFSARHFFIDSLMRVEGLEENYPAQGTFVTNLQTIAKKTDGHIHLVAHPKKIDEDFRTKKMDVKGSSMLVNNADNVVTMRRNTQKRKLIEEEAPKSKLDEMHDAEFAVEKQRETGWEGVIKLKYCRLTKTYEPFVPPKKEPRENPHKKHYKGNE